MVQKKPLRPIDEQDARAMFSRVLQSWASDVLSLRRRGLDRPSFRYGLWTGSNAAGPWPFAGQAERRARAA